MKLSDLLTLSEEEIHELLKQCQKNIEENPELAEWLDCDGIHRYRIPEWEEELSERRLL